MLTLLLGLRLSGRYGLFLPNWFKLTPMGRLRERLFVKVPAAYAALRLARSLVDKEY
jgi:hypothetical protein